MKKNVFKLLLIILSCPILLSCGDDDADNSTSEPKFTWTSTGAYILNEGSYYSGINGSLSYINYEAKTITNGLFYTQNARSLGGTPNALTIDTTTGEMYIACSDENRIEIVNQEVISVGYITISQPRNMVIVDGYVYTTSYDGKIYKISTATHSIVAKSDVVGACLEGVAFRDGYLYVCNAYNTDYTYNTNVVKMRATNLEKVGDIEVACNPTSIRNMGDDLYVLSYGNYNDVVSQVQKIDSSDNVSYFCDGTFFDVASGKIYVINSVTDWTTYESTNTYTIYTTSGTATTMPVPCAIDSPCGIAVDAYTGKICLSSYVLGSYGYTDYTADGYVVVFSEDVAEGYEKYTAGVGPATIVFNTQEKAI